MGAQVKGNMRHLVLSAFIARTHIRRVVQERVPNDVHNVFDGV